MSRSLDFNVTAQPDEVTCGPACLHSVYRYYGDEVSLDALIADVRMLDAGGTLDVYLANHALERGYQATIQTFNLQVFDPTWFSLQSNVAALNLRNINSGVNVDEDEDTFVDNDRNLDGEVLDVGGQRSGQRLHLRPALDLEDAGRLRPLDRGIDARVVERDPREVDVLAADPGDLVHGTLDGGEHPEAEQVNFEKAGIGA